MKTTLYLKHMFSFKRTFIIYFILLLYPFNVLFRLTYNDDANKLFCLMHEIVFSVYTATFLLIPLFLLLIEHNAILFSNNNVIVKLKTRANWWKEGIKLLLFVDIAIFTLFTNTLVYLPILAVKKIFSIHFNLIANAFKIALLQFLGYGVLGMLFIAVRLFTGKRYMAFIAPFTIVALDYIFLQFGIDIDILIRHMFMPININQYTGQLDVLVWMYSLIYLIGFFIVTYLLSSRLITKKDLLEEVTGEADFQ